MKRVIIIGAGIAGLTCGNYLQLNGFDTEIYELHNIPGGECTGWDRGPYHFDGCIHWLVGSKPGMDLNGLWRDTGALDDSVRIINHEIFTRYEEAGAAVNLYTNADKLEKHLLEISPEDKKEIKSFCKSLRVMGSMGMPLDKPMDKMTAGDGIKYAAKNMKAISSMSKYGKLTMKEFAEQFTSPLLRRAFLSAIPGDYTSMALIATLAGMHAGDCGYPEGGSRALAKRMEQKFIGRGGKVSYKSRVEKILVKDGKACGIRLSDGREIAADYVISCADAYATFNSMLDGNYTPELYKNLFENPKKYPTITSAQVFLGVDADIPCDYRGVAIKREKPVSINGMESDNVQILHYGYDKHTAPEGKTVLACYYLADYDYWKALHADREKYKAAKKELAEDAIAAVTARYPEAAGKIETTDVVTPVTYERYCNAWRGTWMTWTKQQDGVPRYYPGVLPGLDNFIIAGMWTLPPGGLPGAAAAGRYAAHRLCMENGVEFKAGK